MLKLAIWYVTMKHHRITSPTTEPHPPRLTAEFDFPPTLPEVYKTIQRLCHEIVEGEESETICNILLGCSEYTLFAFSWPGARPGSKVWNGLYYTISQPPFTSAELIDMDYAVDFSKVTTSTDRVAVITTKPLTKNETWVEMQRGDLLMFDKGLPYSQAADCAFIEKEGRGLSRRKLSCDSNDTFVTDASLESIMVPVEVATLTNTLAGGTDVDERVAKMMTRTLPHH